MQGKTKEEIDLGEKKVLLFHFGGLGGFLGVCERRGGMLSGYRMAPSAVENINPVWPSITHWQGQGCTRF